MSRLALAAVVAGLAGVGLAQAAIFDGFGSTEPALATTAAASAAPGAEGARADRPMPGAPAGASSGAAVATAAQQGRTAKATFAGGCFWCMEPPFDTVPGVISTTSGYTGGTKKHPTYEEVSAGGTGHAESVEVLYDPGKVTYQHLLEIYWHNVDPLTRDRQFCDVGHQYRTAIFYHDAEQHRLADSTKAALAGRFKEPIVTEIVPAGPFWPAEEYHQDYYKKNPIRYHFYRTGCGRDSRLEEVWGEH